MTIRLWKLGHLDKDNIHNSVLPSRDSIEKLREILRGMTGDGTYDLVWGPELNCEVVEIEGPSVTVHIVCSAAEAEDVIRKAKATKND